MKYLLILILYTLFGQHLINLNSDEYTTREKESKYLTKSYIKYIVWYLGKESTAVSIEPEIKVRLELLSSFIPYGMREPVAFFTSFAALTTPKECTTAESIYWCSTPYNEDMVYKMAIRLNLIERTPYLSPYAPWCGELSFWLGGKNYHENAAWYINKWRKDYFKLKIFNMLSELPMFLKNKDWQYNYESEDKP